MTFAVATIGRLFFDLAFEIITAPVWWYTHGLVWFVRACGRSMQRELAGSGVTIWVRNLFTPMFGQTDAWGRVISFIIRLANIVVRTLRAGVWFLLLAVACLAWILAPLAAVYMAVYSLMKPGV